jgi:hypothetical protein
MERPTPIETLGHPFEDPSDDVTESLTSHLLVVVVSCPCTQCDHHHECLFHPTTTTNETRIFGES